MNDQRYEIHQGMRFERNLCTYCWAPIPLRLSKTGRPHSVQPSTCCAEHAKREQVWARWVRDSRLDACGSAFGPGNTGWLPPAGSSLFAAVQASQPQSSAALVA